MVKMYPFHDSERKVEFNISKIIRKYAVDMERVTKSVEHPVYQEQIQFCQEIQIVLILKLCQNFEFKRII